MFINKKLLIIVMAAVPGFVMCGDSVEGVLAKYKPFEQDLIHTFVHGKADRPKNSGLPFPVRQVGFLGAIHKEESLITYVVEKKPRIHGCVRDSALRSAVHEAYKEAVQQKREPVAWPAGSAPWVLVSDFTRCFSKDSMPNIMCETKLDPAAFNTLKQQYEKTFEAFNKNN